MTDKKAYLGCDIFDGHTMHHDAALLIEENAIAQITPEKSITSDYELFVMDGGLIAPGLIDLQVNGGGGILLNDEPTLSGIKKICDAHLKLGTTSILPTLITDTPEITKRAIEAGTEATEKSIDGFLGLHLEGPHLAGAKKGAHSENHIRPMTDLDVQMLCEARINLPSLMVTLAPETVSDAYIKALDNAGVIVSLGHTQTSAVRAKEAFAAGAKCATHLFNAMSGLTHREPGLVGAVLTTPDIYAGLIADGLHVEADVINIALRAKPETTNLFLVSDAMSPAGTDITEFQLNQRRVLRQSNKLTLEDGTLAGADLDLVSAIRFIVENTDLTLESAIKMATAYPAQCLGLEQELGLLRPGVSANFIHLDTGNQLTGVWRSGTKL